jgi:hypothetical protein
VRAAKSALIVLAFTLSLLPASLTESAQASTNGCPSTWTIADTSYPISSTSDFATAISNAGARAQAFVTFIGLPSLASTQAKQYLNIRLVTPNDLTPVLGAIDPARSILLSGKSVVVDYNVALTGCTPPTKFEFKGQFPNLQVTRSSITEYLKVASALPEPLKSEITPDSEALSSTTALKLADADLANCQKGIEAIVASGFDKRTGDSFPFSGLCPVAAGRLQSIHLVAETDACLFPAADRSILDSPYVLAKNIACKVAFARTLGQESANGSVKLGPTQLFILREFTLKSGTAASAATVEKLSNPELTQPAPARSVMPAKPSSTSPKTPAPKAPSKPATLKTIACIKGSLSKKVTGAKPICPAGYVLKK